MNSIVRNYLSSSPLWTIARNIKDPFDLSAWERHGRLVPPPNAYKRQVIREYATQYQLRTMIETGTFNGEMDFAMKGLFSRIVTIELSSVLHAAALRRFARFPHIECLLGDSSTILPPVLAGIIEPCLFWLDAHRSPAGGTARGDVETPISVELDAVLNHSVRKHIVLIDDAWCFDGTHDYPDTATLRETVLKMRPDLSFAIKDEIIRITPKDDPASD